jgi:metal-dependent amidase/aminoacylase/carboxypeptidase family protein
MIQVRRDLHAHPELAGAETRTAGIIADRLKAYGLEVRTGVGGTGVVGVLRGRSARPVVAYRADMDGLLQNLAEDVPWRSTSSGVAHACGHDVHVAVALGVAEVLSALKSDLPGTVVFLFQPAEETIEGAKRMIAAGAMDTPRPDVVFALHVAPFDAGLIATTPGVGLPGLERFTVRIKGATSSAEIANDLLSAIRTAGTVRFPGGPADWQRILADLQTRGSALARFAWVNAAFDSSSAGEHVIRGSVKASGEDEYTRVLDLVRSRAADLERQGTACTVASERVLPDVRSDAALGEWAVGPLGEAVGPTSVVTIPNSLPFFGEDFAFYLQKSPGVLFWLGGGSRALPHSPAFQVDERAIGTGIVAMANLVTETLRRQSRTGRR